MQLANRDKEGMTMAMLATRSGNMAIVSAVLTEITQTEVRNALPYRAPVPSAPCQLLNGNASNNRLDVRVPATASIEIVGSNVFVEAVSAWRITSK